LSEEDIVDGHILGRAIARAAGSLPELVVCTTYILYTHMGSRFDADKDVANIAKHGLSLVEREGVLNDPLGLSIEDDSSEGAKGL
jgi:hypothetical protein